MNPQAQELISYDMSSKPEREANVFAAEILLPDDEVIRLINDAEMNFSEPQGNFMYHRN